MTTTAMTAPSENTIGAFLKQAMPRIAAVIPKHMDPDRVTKIALTAISRNPLLLQCTRESLLLALMEAAQLGLEVSGVMGQAYLVPRKNGRLSNEAGHDVYEAQFQIGYRGLTDLARRSGEVLSVEARVVHEKDHFFYQYGLDQTLDHQPSMEVERGPLTYVYAIARMKDGPAQFDVMSRAEVELIRARSMAKNNGPWVTDYNEMAKKTVVRRLAKSLPLTIEAQAAIEMDGRVDIGERVNLGTFEPGIETVPMLAEPVGGTRTESVTEKLQQRRPRTEAPATEPTAEDKGKKSSALEKLYFAQLRDVHDDINPRHRHLWQRTHIGIESTKDWTDEHFRKAVALLGDGVGVDLLKGDPIAVEDAEQEELGV